MSDDEEDDEIAISKAEHYHIYVHVHDKEVHVSCGDATQRLKWLAHVGIARWDEVHCQGWKRLGIPTTIRLKAKNGEEVEMGLIIKDVLKNGDHVYVETSLAPSETR